MLLLLFSLLADEQQTLVEKIYDENYSFFLKIAKGITRSEVHAEDAVSNAFLKIIQNIKQISDLPCHELRPFCVVIVKNCAIDIMRKSQKYVSGTDDQVVQNVSEAYNPEKNVIDSEYILNMKRMLGTLDDDDRVLIMLRYVHGMKYSDISKAMMISEVAARKRCQRTLEKLRQLYKEM